MGKERQSERKGGRERERENIYIYIYLKKKTRDFSLKHHRDRDIVLCGLKYCAQPKRYPNTHTHNTNTKYETKQREFKLSLSKDYKPTNQEVFNVTHLPVTFVLCEYTISSYLLLFIDIFTLLNQALRFVPFYFRLFIYFFKFIVNILIQCFFFLIQNKNNAYFR